MTPAATFITHRGLQPYLRNELTQRFNVNVTNEPIPGFTADPSKNDLLRTVYLSQALRRATLTITTKKHNGLTDINLPDHDALNRLNNTTYRVTCERHGDHDFTSVDVEQRIGGQLTDHDHTNIDLTSPENTVYVAVYQDAYHVGLDLTGRDLTQRQYKVFSSNEGINAALAYSFTQEAKPTPGSTIVNPFGRDGVIPIETALEHAGVSVNHYDHDFRFDTLKLYDFFTVDDHIDDINDSLTDKKTSIHSYDRDFRNLKAQKKNAKIAGVDDHIEFSRFEPEYIDLKFNDFDVDLIYGRPPRQTRHFPEDKLRRVYHDLFRYGKYVLTENGEMTFLTQDTELLKEYAEQFTLNITEKTTITYKHQDHTAVTLQREHPSALEATHI